MFKPDKTRNKFIILAVMTGLIALFHFTTPTESHHYHQIHIMLRKLYFLPPLVAAAWLGLRGACFAALAVSLLVIIHWCLDWPDNYLEQANQVGELIGFWIAAFISGWLFDRQRSLLLEVANANEETLLALVSALDLREHNTSMHSRRVREYTELIARQYGVDEEGLREIDFGALLHDVGKIAVPDSVLLKPTALTEAEWQEMRKHPEAGYRIVKRIGFLKDAAEIVYAHQERYDGKGYPRGLKGDEIPLGARLFKVADVYDALTSHRPYREPSTYEEAVATILKLKGSQFDPAVVAAFMAVPQDELRRIAERYRDNGASPADSLS